MTSKYVTQGEREMVEAVVGGGMVCECDGSDLIEESFNTGVLIGRPAPEGNGLSIYGVTADTNESPVLIHTRAGGTATSRGIDFNRDDVMERGSRIATRDWVYSQLPSLHVIETEEQWLVSSDRTLLGITFASVGNHEFEYQHNLEAQITFYPRVGSSNAPSPWVTFQHRYMDHVTFGHKLRVRCVSETGDTIPFVVQVRRVTPP